MSVQLTERGYQEKIKAAKNVARLRNKPICVCTWDYADSRKRGLWPLDDIGEEFEAFCGIIECTVYPDGYISED